MEHAIRYPWDRESTGPRRSLTIGYKLNGEIDWIGLDVGRSFDTNKLLVFRSSIPTSYSSTDPQQD